ncbi:hypothetical protein LJR029_005484 [Caballeronia sp. LjRoot29]|uniref:hypothetical protein n=1 Tax=Caballeronia sp. LjRoot29 TaxID=3342315 RepID=UPI003ECD34DE
MNKFAVVENDVVVGVISAGADSYTPGFDQLAIEIPEHSVVSIGWTHDGARFIAPLAKHYGLAYGAGGYGIA